MRVFRFLGRILKRASADVGKAANEVSGTNANKVNKLHDILGGGDGG